jgi:hypothetical protein
MRIQIVEDHDLAYKVWIREGVNSAILVHVDAHLDYMGIENNSFIHIGNFLAFAFQKQVYNKLIWVIPTPSFVNSCNRKRILEILSKDFEIQSINKIGICAFSKDNLSFPVIVTCMECLNFYLYKECKKTSILI